jgi:hypothetical protein
MLALTPAPTSERARGPELGTRLGGHQKHRHRDRQTTRNVALPAELAPNRIGAAAALFVDRCWRKHGAGPTRAELAGYLHPDCRSTCAATVPTTTAPAVMRRHQQLLAQRLIHTGWLIESGTNHWLSVVY